MKSLRLHGLISAKQTNPDIKCSIDIHQPSLPIQSSVKPPLIGITNISTSCDIQDDILMPDTQKSKMDNSCNTLQSRKLDYISSINTRYEPLSSQSDNGIHESIGITGTTLQETINTSHAINHCFSTTASQVYHNFPLKKFVEKILHLQPPG